jgi:alcohol dehydrogenase (NADP+)
MAVKLAAALGADVTVFSTLEEKQADALQFGATDFVISTDTKALENLELKYDFLLLAVGYF